MLSSVPFIAELPQDLAGKATSLFTVHGRYGNNALNGDWELGITSNTSAPPQQQSQRTWKSGTPEPFTFAITKMPASLTAPAATSGDFTIGGSNVKASYTDIASYEPNAIKIWARSTTTGSGVTINDLKIKTPGVPGETVFPGTVINVSQDIGPVFQEIIIAGVDFKSSPSGSVTLEGNVAMQFGNDPAPRGSSVQFHVIATHVPWVDLDVDSNNIGGIDDRNGRRGTDDPIEDRTDLPGVIVPVGGSRAKMVVDVAPGRTATLAFDADAAKKVRVYSPSGALALDQGQLSTPIFGGPPQTFWIEAFAPSESMADIAFTLTPTGGSSASGDRIRATAVEVDLDVDSNNNDRLDKPKRDADEEKKEPTVPKRIVVNDNDTDGDHVPDYADWVIATPAGPVKRFTPLVVQIPASLPLASMQLAVSYAASDPTLIGPDRRLPDDSATNPLRIWTKNAGELRNTAGVIAGGNFVPAGRIADLSTLGFTDSTRTVELYVEGIHTTTGVPQPISIQLTVGGRATNPDLVKVVVVSNTLVIGIDGTDSAEWLAKKDKKGNLINERTMPDGSTRWNSHVRNLVADCEPFAMTYYTAGPDQRGLSDDSDVVFRRARDAARALIQDAGGGTTIALVGWSRGAMIASGVAHELLTLADGDLPRTVAFIGMYDPVDMSNGIPPAWATIHAGVQAVTIIGPTADGQTEDAFNVDYPVSGYRGVDNWTFERMARGNRITTAQGAAAEPQRILYNASHGAIGGTPGYNKRHRDGGAFPENYDYTLDVRDSIRADKGVRAGMRAAGLPFVPDRDAAWYGFPDDRPPKEHRE